MQFCNAVFEGGGVRGIGHVGAVEEFERQGYIFNRVAGSSAGAIVASLIAAGYSGAEIRKELENLDYSEFLDCKNKLLCPAEKTIRLFWKLGLHSGDFFLEWMTSLLNRKNIATFGDLKKIKTIENNQNKEEKNRLKIVNNNQNIDKDNNKLQKAENSQNSDNEKNDDRLKIVVSDISAQKILVFPRDANLFGIRPDDFSIALAVRMSMSLPFYYAPITMKDTKGLKHQLIDGGVLSKYPIWLLDNGESNPKIPTFGFRFVSSRDATGIEIVKEIGLLEYGKCIVETMMNGFDNYHLSESKGEKQRTVLISCDIETGLGVKSVKSADFEISELDSNALYENGKYAAKQFLQSFDFEDWKRSFRSVKT